MIITNDSPSDIEVPFWPPLSDYDADIVTRTAIFRDSIGLLECRQTSDVAGVMMLRSIMNPCLSVRAITSAFVDFVVMLEDLPYDMTREELHDVGSDFGTVKHTYFWDDANCKIGALQYQFMF